MGACLARAESMILELLALGGALGAGRAAWRRRRRRTPPRPELQVPDQGPTEMRWLDSELASGTTALALAGASFLMRSTPLGLASAPFTVWSARRLFGEAHRSFVRERRMGFVVVDAGLTVVGLVAGFYIMAAGGTMIYVGWRKLNEWERVQAGRARSKASAATTETETVWRALDAVGEWAIPAEAIDLGERIRVRDGDGIPVDAWVAAGTARVDPRDGRLQPLALGPGDRVPAGGRVISGTLELRARGGVGDSRHGRLREQPNASPLDLEPIAERAGRLADASAGFTVFTGALAALTLGSRAALTAFGANLIGPYRVIAPAALENHLHALGALGVRIEDGRRFELIAGASVFMIDLGTLLDTDHLGVSSVRAVADFDPGLGLRYAAGLMGDASEPARPALLDALALRGLAPIGDAVAPRGGVFRGWIAGRAVALGDTAALSAEGITGDGGLDAVRRAARRRGESTLTLAVDGAEVAVIAFEAQPRPGAETLLPELRRRGIEPILLVAEGDSVADHWTERLGAGQVVTQRDPEAIAEYVQSLRAAGRMVAAVGDRVVHRPMMGAADVSLSLTSDQAVARGAGVVLLAQPLDRIPALIDLARRYHRAQGRLMAWDTAATGVLGFSVLAFGMGPVAALGVQVLGAAAGLISTLPDVEALAGPPPVSPTEVEADPADAAPLRDVAVHG